MATHDTIGDALTRLRNAAAARHQSLEVRGSNLVQKLVELLRDEGYLANVKVVKDKPQKVLKITLKYDAEKKPVFSRLQRVSKPSRRVYVESARLRPVLGGLGVAIVSTSQGLMTDRQARQARLGGEVICEVW